MLTKYGIGLRGLMQRLRKCGRFEVGSFIIARALRQLLEDVLPEKSPFNNLELDEIGELQPKLLQVIQTGEFERLGSSDTIKVDVRIIAVTNRNLEEEVEREYIIRVQEQVKWKASGQNSAAEILGFGRSTLRARMRKLNIEKS